MLLEESFHNCFYNFMEALRILSMDAVKQCEVMDNFNVAREIRQDVTDDGAALVNWPGDYLAPSERSAIENLLQHLNALPEEALLRHDHKRAMTHPKWDEIRQIAGQLTHELSDAKRRNQAYFDGNDASG